MCHKKNSGTMQCTNTANDMLIIKDFKYLRTTVLKQGNIIFFTGSGYAYVSHYAHAYVFISGYASCSFTGISPVTWKKTLQFNALF